MIVLSSILPNTMIAIDAFPNIVSSIISAEEVAELLSNSRDKITTHLPHNNMTMAISETLGVRVRDDYVKGLFLKDVGDVFIWARYNGPFMDNFATRMPDGGRVQFLRMEITAPEEVSRPITSITLDQFKKMQSFPVQLGDFMLGDKFVKLVTQFRNGYVHAVIEDHVFAVNHLAVRNITDFMEGVR